MRIRFQPGVTTFLIVTNCEVRRWVFYVKLQGSFLILIRIIFAAVEMKIEGTVALVTGGAMGIGKAVAETLLQNGAKVSSTFGLRR